MSLLAIQDGSHIAILRLINMVCVTVYTFATNLLCGHRCLCISSLSSGVRGSRLPVTHAFRSVSYQPAKHLHNVHISLSVSNS